MAMVTKNQAHLWRINFVHRLLDPPRDVDYIEATTCHTGISRNVMIEWELMLVFNESRSKNRDWISLEIRIQERFKRVFFTFKIWMLTANGARVRMDPDDLSQEIDYSSVYTIPHFINKDGLFVNFEEYAPGGVLQFIYEFNIESCHMSSYENIGKRERIEREIEENKESKAQDGDETPSAPKRALNHDNYNKLSGQSFISEV